jgi:hypothetical protein
MASPHDVPTRRESANMGVVNDDEFAFQRLMNVELDHVDAKSQRCLKRAGRILERVSSSTPMADNYEFHAVF